MATPAKIVLKNSTKISLNDRFSGIMKSRPAVTSASIRAQSASDRFASEKNRRLAQQMERRPSVAAELGTQTRSVRDRLGTVPSSRGRSPRGTVRGRGRGRFVRGRGQTRGMTRGMTRGVTRGQGRGFSRGRSPRAGSRGAGRGRGRGRGRGTSRGRGSFTRRAAPDKQKLDDQLDNYMNKTKGAMNAELDTYMAEIDN